MSALEESSPVDLTGLPGNLTPFGQAVERLATHQYGWFIERHGFGFTDGGCGILADAFVAWSGGALRLHAIDRMRPGGTCAGTGPDHLVAGDGSLFVDRDGLAQAAELVARYSAVELRGDPCRLLPYPGGFGRRGIPASSSSAARIAAALTRRFGGWQGSLAQHAGLPRPASRP